MKTKKSFIKTGILLIMLFALSTVVSQAQEYWTVGPKAGASFSALSNVDNPKIQTGFSGGVFALYSRWNHFGISSDLLYTEKISKYDTPLGFGNDAGVVTINPSLKYIEMPMLANFFFFDPSSKVRPKIVLGPSFGYLVSKQGDNPIFKTFDLGAVGGIGANVRLSQRMWLNVDGRYNYGLLDVTKAPGNVMNRNLSATVGVGFGIGK